MEQVRLNPSSRPATPTPSAETGQVFGAAMQSGSAASIGENVELRGERSALDGLVRDLGHEIQRLLAQFSSLQAAAGRAEAAHHGQINMLLTQIAGLAGSIDLAQARNSPEYRRAVGAMQSLHGRLADERAVWRGGRAATGEALAGLQSRQGEVQAALAQILQLLSALQMRMGAMGALI
ncbi:MAG TPA: hypothetical protein VLQ65_04765 [Saliniramus sp.]|nr:hypothetical protein [Saliniramus sp.]